MVSCGLAAGKKGSGGLFEQRLITVGNPWAPRVQVPTPQQAVANAKEAANFAIS